MKKVSIIGLVIAVFLFGILVGGVLSDAANDKIINQYQEIIESYKQSIDKHQKAIAEYEVAVKIYRDVINRLEVKAK